MNPKATGKILVVDDEETMRRSLADILRLEGYEVQTAASGETAVEILKQSPPDLMLLDLKMPGMDGMDVLRLVEKLAPDTLVILLTAHGSLESAIDALRHQAFDYLLKPSTPRQILAAVEKALVSRAEELAKRMLIDQLDLSLQKLRGAERGEPIVSQPPSVFPLGGGLVADFTRRQVWAEGSENQAVNLTSTENKLLKVLVEHAGLVLSHRELVLQVQGYDVTEWEAPEMLRPLVSRLRQKLARFPGGEKLIINIRGAGYILDRRSG